MAGGVLVAGLAATWAMVGIVWFVQIVHYPMLRHGAGPGFSAIAEEHARRTGRVVGPLMAVEAATALWLLVDRPEGVPLWTAALAAALLAVVWALTAFVQVPHHAALRRGFSAATHRALLAGNAVRTAVWSARGAVVAGMAITAVT